MGSFLGLLDSSWLGSWGLWLRNCSLNHRHGFVANNYYCLPNILHSLKSFKCMKAAIDQSTDDFQLNEKIEQKNVTSSKNRSLTSSLVDDTPWPKEAKIIKSHSKTNISDQMSWMVKRMIIKRKLEITFYDQYEANSAQGTTSTEPKLR